MSANDKQVGGTHYAQGGNVQHWDFITLNGIGYLEGCATKYVSRWRKKHGVLDLQKALHYVEKLQELFLTGQIEAPLRGPTVITPEAFAAANGLDARELFIVERLTFWESQGDLRQAFDAIQSLIDAQALEVPSQPSA